MGFLTGAALAWLVVFLSALVAMALCVDWKGGANG